MFGFGNKKDIDGASREPPSQQDTVTPLPTLGHTAAIAEDVPATLRSETVWKGIRLAPIVIGALFLGLSLILEHPYFLGYADSVIQNSNDEKGKKFVSFVFTNKMAILFVAEIGYAFIIAGIVANFLELNAKREQIEWFRLAQDLIKRDVFEAVYKIKHSDKYVKAVIDTCFESPLVREDYRITYEIDAFPAEDAFECGVDRHNYVLITATVTYTARNMGADFQKFPTGYGIPFRPGALERFAKLRSLKVGLKTYSPDEIAKLEEKRTNEDHTSEKEYNFEVPTEPGARTPVAIEVALVKEISDNDAFGFRRPTIGAFIQLINRMEKVVSFGVTPRTSAQLREVRPRSLKTGEWEIVGPILPFDSVILWWRKPGLESAHQRASHIDAEPSEHISVTADVVANGASTPDAIVSEPHNVA